MPTLSHAELDRLSDVCSSIANAASDERGFVPVRNLLKRFGAQALFRPLLVEGILAAREGDVAGDARWLVLLDSDTYKVNEDSLLEENHERILDSRLRNTIAHELVHSLAFRKNEFGVDLRRFTEGKSSKAELIDEIEKETEKFSPLLLIPDKALRPRLLQPLTVADFQTMTRQFGVSKYVLLNRFLLLRSRDVGNLLPLAALKNLGLGIAEWTSEGDAVLYKWPLFLNFDRNVIPRFLLQAKRQDRVSAKQVIGESNFAMCGGNAESILIKTLAGVDVTGRPESMRIEVSCASANRRAGTRFLFAVRCV